MNIHTIYHFQYKETFIIPNLHQRIFSKGLKNEFERAVVNEPSVFDCIRYTTRVEHDLIHHDHCIMHLCQSVKHFPRYIKCACK